jgi:hypothetical protein
MIIDNLNLVCTIFLPDETYSILVIDPDTVLSCPVALELFKAVAWWDSQVGERASGVNQ